MFVISLYDNSHCASETWYMYLFLFILVLETGQLMSHAVMGQGPANRELTLDIPDTPQYSPV